MTAQSPRKARDFWISPLKMKTALSCEPHFLCWDKEISPGNIHVREILPDEIRVSVDDWRNLKKLMFCLEPQEAFIGAHSLMERIERESLGEVSENSMREQALQDVLAINKPKKYLGDE